MAPVTTPMAVAHLLMDGLPDAGPLDDIKTKWAKIHFEAVDVLNVSAFIVQPDRKSFGLEPNLTVKEEMLTWVVETARARNSNVKILAQQFWGSAGWNILDTSQIDAYATSVAQVIEKYGLDGYDVDYEWWGTGTGNQIPEAPIILATVRAKLEDLSKTLNRPLYVTLSPASTDNLTSDNPAAKDHPIKNSVHWVNIQTYDGGWNNNNQVASWLELGFTSKQLTYGVWPENTVGVDADGNRGVKHSPTLDEVINAYTGQQLGGVNLWRLTSGNYLFESQVQSFVYNFLHGKTSDPPSKADMDGLWPLLEKEQIDKYNKQ